MGPPPLFQNKLGPTSRLRRCWKSIHHRWRSPAVNPTVPRHHGWHRFAVNEASRVLSSQGTVGRCCCCARRSCRTSHAPLRSVASIHVSCRARAPHHGILLGTLHQLLRRASRYLSLDLAGRTNAHRARRLKHRQRETSILPRCRSSRTRGWRVPGVGRLIWTA